MKRTTARVPAVAVFEAMQATYPAARTPEPARAPRPAAYAGRHRGAGQAVATGYAPRRYAAQRPVRAAVSGLTRPTVTMTAGASAARLAEGGW